MWEGKGTLAKIREERHLVAPGLEEETDPLPHSSRGKQSQIPTTQQPASPLNVFPIRTVTNFQNIRAPKPNFGQQLHSAREYQSEEWQRASVRNQSDQGNTKDKHEL